MTVATRPATEYIVCLRSTEGHQHQQEFVESKAKRKVVRAGRRGGKTVGAGIIAVEAFLAQRRVLYAAPTQEQVDTFWFEVCHALRDPIEAKRIYKNESRHIIELPGTKTRIRGKTAWDADSLRGDYADLLILDEFQLMNEDAWDLVGAPMLLDNNGDAVFIYTPPSFRMISRTKARDPRHAAKLFKKAEADKSGRWQAFHFSSRENPHISMAALSEISQDMSALAIRQEIEAEDIEEIPGALFKMRDIDAHRIMGPADLPTHMQNGKEWGPDATVLEMVRAHLIRVVIGVDPAISATSMSNETGIIANGKDGRSPAHYYVLGDHTVWEASPDKWGRATVAAFNIHRADRAVPERNQGGDMVVHTLRTIDRDLPITAVHATRGKLVRAEPIAALYEQGRVHHVGHFPELEDQMCSYVPGMPSPDRMDANVWGLTFLKGGADGDRGQHNFEGLGVF